ncbi:hypothetical protein EV701_10127 [Chthoniobacter flavus]|nr:hypothetical protein EV701_10127 [Chthoniobacter flavus]
MHQTNHFESITREAIENQVIPNRKATKSRRQIIYFAPDSWAQSDYTQCSIKLINQPIGRREIMHRNIGPDLLVIAARSWRAKDSKHSPFASLTAYPACDALRP